MELPALEKLVVLRQEGPLLRCTGCAQGVPRGVLQGVPAAGCATVPGQCVCSVCTLLVQCLLRCGARTPAAHGVFSLQGRRHSLCREGWAKRRWPRSLGGGCAQLEDTDAQTVSCHMLPMTVKWALDLCSRNPLSGLSEMENSQLFDYFDECSR